MKKILWLVSWYPDKLEPLSGDFIERHARAASLLHFIEVLFVVKDPAAKKTSSEKRAYHTQLNASIMYYPPTFSWKPLESLVSGIRYLLYFRRLIKKYIAENGKPHLVHVHICYKAGLAALYCKWRYGIRYVVSEQWTVFCPEAKPGFEDQSPIARRLQRIIYRNASRCSTVSEYLGKCIAEKFGIPVPVRIPNVVDTTLFRPVFDQRATFRFIHISTLKYQKNPVQMLEAAKLLKAKTSLPFELVVFGPLIPELRGITAEYDIEELVHFKGEVLHDVLSKELSACDAMVFYSRFETFGCVIIEAYASGLPVIVSDIPVMHEIVQENINGFFVPLDQPDMLAEKMLWVMRHRGHFDRALLAKHAREYYEFVPVARKFKQLYDF